jgi:hypothetical protein
MNGLYPIIRRQRRPLWPAEEPKPAGGVVPEAPRQSEEASCVGAGESLAEATVPPEAATTATPSIAATPGSGPRRAGKSIADPKRPGAAGERNP